MASTDDDGRFRLIRIESDGGRPVYHRAAPNAAAQAQILVAPDRHQDNIMEQPSLVLAVQPDGSWTVRRWAAGPARADDHEGELLASGMVDPPKALIVAADHVECPYCGAEDALTEVDRTDRWNPCEITVIKGSITKVVWSHESYGDAEVVRYQCGSCDADLSVDLSSARQDYQ